MRNARTWICAAATVLAASPAWAQSTHSAFQNAVDAYVYGYPLVTMEMTRRVSTNVASPTDSKAPMGQFARLRAFPPPSDHTVTAPNADTLYTIAWFDVSQGPWLVSIPDMGDRYYLAPMLDGWTEVITAPGTRTTGDAAQQIVITGPGFQGELPEGATEWKSPTALVWLLGRIYTTGTKEDRVKVHALQDQFTAMPLSAWGKAYQPPPGRVDGRINTRTAVRDQVDAMDTQSYFDLLAKLMLENPPAPADAPMINKMHAIGLFPGKGYDPRRLGPFTINDLKGVPKAAQERIRSWLSMDGFSAGDLIRQNGWTTTLVTGIYGTNYIQRAAIAAVGLGANKPEDAIYPTSMTDASGKPYSGANRYLMHFPADQLPPTQGFWSLTAYDPQFFFTPNALNRYSLGKRDALKLNKDGSMDLYIQHDSPGKDLEANWLPIPADKFVLMLRMYWPSAQPPSILDGSWRIPAVTRVQQTAAK